MDRLIDNIKEMLSDNAVSGQSDYSAIAHNLGGICGFHLVDWYERPGYQGFTQSGMGDHYVQFFLPSDLTTVYLYEQPYSVVGDIETGTEVKEYTLVFQDGRSLYNEQTITRLWRLDISDYALYIDKGSRQFYPTSIVNCKLDPSDRKFKQLVQYKGIK